MVSGSTKKVPADSSIWTPIPALRSGHIDRFLTSFTLSHRKSAVKPPAYFTAPGIWLLESGQLIKESCAGALYIYKYLLGVDCQFRGTFFKEVGKKSKVCGKLIWVFFRKKCA